MPEKLTMRQERLVQALPEASSQREAGLKAGYSPRCIDSVVSEVLSNPKVKRAYEMEKVARSDKARGELSKFERVLTRFSGAVDRIDPAHLDTQTLMGSLQILQKLRESELSIRERYGIDKNSEPEVKAQQARSLQRIIAIAVRCAVERPAVAARILARDEAKVGHASRHNPTYPQASG